MSSDDSELGNGGPISCAVYICTYKRNEPLARMLDSLEVAATKALPAIELAVIVVDDNGDGRAKAVVDNSEHKFALGLHYELCGTGNISEARNIGVAAAMKLGDWVGMVDDDQIVVPEWLDEIFKTQQQTKAEAVTAPVYMKFEDAAPEWIRSQPFSNFWGTALKEDGAKVSELQTANSIISTTFLENHPDVRFSNDLGKSGGEDMVFYHKAVSLGLKAHYSLHAVSWELEPAERATYRYQLQRCLWHGNTEAVTNLRSGRASRLRLLLRAAKRLVKALLHPLRRLGAGKGPQLRYTFAFMMQSVGMVAGVAGIKLQHR